MSYPSFADVGTAKCLAFLQLTNVLSIRRQIVKFARRFDELVPSVFNHLMAR